MQLTIKPKQVVKRLLATLPERARDVLIGRYGLGPDSNRMTLEAIGEKYDITRERVRQIENYAIATIKKSDVFKKEKDAFLEIHKIIDSMGTIVPEEELLEHLSKEESTRNHILLLLVLGEEFTRMKENEECKTCWVIDPELERKVRTSMKRLYEKLSDDELIPEGQLIDTFLTEVKELNQKYKDAEVIKRWLSTSKTIGRNPLGEWGRAHSPNVKVKGMRDYAYLAIKRHGSPMHFREVAKAIERLFNKRAHEATTHNELIKDARFVLVGRGLYALKEWGYSAGVVKDVIKDVIKKFGPLSRDEVIDKVKKERYVKDNTIVVNLQDPSIFRKTKDGKYALS